MANPTFQKLIDDLETAVSAWENNPKPYFDDDELPYFAADELDLYRSLRQALDTYYAEVARR